MKDFDKLSEQGQLRRMRRCSLSLLQRYGISDPKLVVLAHHRQTTFKVQSQKTGDKYLLRFHRSAYRHPATVRSELCWLRSLRNATNVVVPEPVTTLDGEDVPSVTGVGLPGDFSCSVMKWIEGKRYFRKNGPGVRVLHQVGQIMAEMHRQAEDFSPPEEFHCPTWNWERLFKQMPEEMTYAERQMLDADHRKLFRDTERRVKATMETLGTKSDKFGIIHGDLIQANYLIQGGEVRVIDFADFGYGHFLYDMGITLFGLWGLDDENRQRKAFLSGYREVRSLSPGQEDLLNLFIAARAVVQARFVMGSQHPGDQKIASRYIRKVIDGLKLWLN